MQISAPTPDLQVIGFDKVVHFCFYFGLNTLLVSTIIAKRGNAKVTHIIATTVASIAYGVAIEFIQKRLGVTSTSTTSQQTQSARSQQQQYS